MLVLVATGPMWAVGCQQSEPPKFRLNMVAMTNNGLDEAFQEDIADALGAVFGTPDDPQVIPETGLDPTRLALAAGNAYSDSKGVERGLYRKHCVHCHGVSGDGRGPTGKFLNPYPRDYRKGVFKFKSTFAGARPTDDDLHRVLWNGAPGSSMPSFSLLPPAELEALVEYVKYLAMRGELETLVAAFVYDELGYEEGEDENGNPTRERIAFNPAEDAEHGEILKDLLAEVVDEWNAAAEQIIVPDEGQIPSDDRSDEEKAASIAKGRELFYDAKKGNCMECHGPTGLGDGNLANLDVWNDEVNKYLSGTQQMANSLTEQIARSELAEDEEQERLTLLALREEVGERLYPVRPIIPRNLRAAIYRGGRRRIDIFHRVFTGINGSGMPGVGGAGPGAQGTLTEDEMWSIVDYVLLGLPYEDISGPQRAIEMPTNAEAIVN